MAYNGIGGSCAALIHAVAAYPAAAAALLAGSLIFATPAGEVCPQDPVVIEQQAQTIIAANPALIAKEAQVKLAFQELKSVPLSDDTIRRVIDRLHCGCEGMTAQDIRQNPQLMEEVGYIYFLDLVRQFGITHAKELYVTGYRTGESG